MNANWHKAHPMPRPASPAKRLAWHAAHAKACGCRAMPAGLQAILDEQRRQTRLRTTR